MRETLFRGKSAFGNEWVYGYLTDGKYYNSEKMFISSFDNSPDRNRQFCRVEPETVGQFTGLTDKNGKKVFEGDIVKDIAGGIYKVVYDTEYMRFAFEQDSIKWGLEGFDGIMDFEVIGNIYDNPELLEAK